MPSTHLEGLNQIWKDWAQDHVQFKEVCDQVYEITQSISPMEFAALFDESMPSFKPLKYAHLRRLQQWLFCKVPEYGYALLPVLEKQSNKPIFEQMEAIELIAYRGDFAQALKMAEKRISQINFIRASDYYVALLSLKRMSLLQELSSQDPKQRVFVEDGADPLVVNFLLRAWSESEFYFESQAYKQKFPEDKTILTIGEVFELNSAEELECYQGVPEFASQMQNEIKKHSSLFSKNNNEVFRANQFLIEDVVFYQLKKVGALKKMLTSKTHSYLYLVSHARMLSSLEDFQADVSNIEFVQADTSSGFISLGGQAKEAIVQVKEAPKTSLFRRIFKSRMQEPVAYRARETNLYYSVLVYRSVKLALFNLFNFKSHFLRLGSCVLGGGTGIRKFWLRLFVNPTLQRLTRFKISSLGTKTNRPMYLFVSAPSPIYTQSVGNLLAECEKVGIEPLVIMRRKEFLPDDDPLINDDRVVDYMKGYDQGFGLFSKKLVRLIFLKELDEIFGDEKVQINSVVGSIPLYKMWKHGLSFILADSYQRSYLYEFFINQLLSKYSPEKIVLCPDRTPESMHTIGKAKLKKCPTFAIQAVYHTRHPKYKPLQADQGSVIDTWSKDIFTQHYGTEENRIFITGSPRYNPPKKLGSIGNHETRKKVLFVCQRGLEFNLANLKFVVKNFNSLKEDYTLIVRPHPSEKASDIESYKNLVSSYKGVQFQVDSEQDLPSLIGESLLVLTAYSNVGLEAAIYGIPVLILNPESKAYSVELEKMGVGVQVTTDNEIATAFDQVLGDQEFLANMKERQENYLRLNPHLLRGDASHKIIELLRTS